MARMRGDDRQPDAMFSYVSAEQRVPHDHPLRAIRALVDEVLALAGSGALHPPEPRVFPLEQAAEALAALSLRRLTGKVVLRP